MVDAAPLAGEEGRDEVSIGDGAPGASVDIAGVVDGLVDYVFSSAFVEEDEDDFAAFIDAFRENGRYRRGGDGSLTALTADFGKAKVGDTDYLALHEVHAALSALSESERVVAVQRLGIALLARQAAELRD